MTCCLLLLTGCAKTLAGKLTTDGGEPVGSADARVNIASLAGDQSVVVPVEPNGEFKTDADLPAGEYLIEALVPGYAISSKRIKLGDGKEPLVELSLSKVERAKARSTSANLDAPQGRGAGGATLTPPSF